MSNDLIKMLIQDFQRSELPSFSKRDLAVPSVPDMSVSIVGSRRCGKTFRTYQYIGEMVAAGWSRSSICRIQFNDHRLAGIEAQNLSMVDQSFYSLHPDIRRGTHSVLFIFDELQRIEGWEDYVLSLLDTRTHRILLTGSTSKLLQGDIASGLRGKNLSVALWPFSFGEFCRYYNVAADTVSSDGQAQLQSFFQRYMNQGGFPGLLAADQTLHIELLQSYWDTMLVRDIAQAHKNDTVNMSSLTALGEALAARTGRPFTVRKLGPHLGESGLHLSLETIHRYIEYFAEACILYAIPLFSPSDSVRRRNYRKAYATDWALADAVAKGGQLSMSRKLETAVFVELRRRGNDVYYFLTRKGNEIDFVADSRKNRSGKPEIYQVCLSIDSPETRDREFEGLPQTASFLGTDFATVITLDQEEEKTIDGCTIRVVPAWKWFLADR